MPNPDLQVANPWRDLPHGAPFVLPQDEAVLDSFHRYEPKANHYRLDLPPDPWQGCWNAPVLLLLQNPSHDGSDVGTYGQAAVREANRRNLNTNAGEEPMYWLADDLKGTYSGRWWRRSLNRLITDIGIDRVRAGLLVVELYGYRSRTFRPIPRTLDSQRFSLRLVTEAMERQAVIILPRASRYWEVALPELFSYAGLVRGKEKTRSAAVSPGNLDADGYQRVVAAIRSGGGGGHPTSAMFSPTPSGGDLRAPANRDARWCGPTRGVPAAAARMNARLRSSFRSTQGAARIAR